MPSEIHLAFSHPSERAAATADATPLDRISVRDHVVEVEIGAFLSEEERLELFEDLQRALRRPAPA